MADLPLISIVDDDESVRESLPDLLRELGFDVRAFSSAEEFLVSDYIDRTSCLILDIAMPGMTGPELHNELRFRRQVIPTIFITAHADESTRPRMMSDGAVECLSKPFSETALINALGLALK
jgi:FixJ family two-component response regulator